MVLEQGPVLWQRGSTDTSFHGYGAKPSVLLDRVGSRHLPPLSWRRQSASVSAVVSEVSLHAGFRVLGVCWPQLPSFFHYWITVLVLLSSPPTSTHRE